jgi:type IV secretion system protein VirD4
VVPNILAAPGAVVTTSTKTDVLALTARSRARRGRTWLFDPSGTVPTPTGLTPLGWSPVSGAQQWEHALATAHVLCRAARPGRGPADADHWSERAQALIAPLLHAAALAELDMSWVLRWVLRRELTEPSVMIGRRGGDELAADTLAGIAGTDERERSGIFSTAAGILAAYRSPTALHVAATPNFEIDAFVRSSDTIYVCAPADAQEQLAPLVVTFLDQIKAAVYRRESWWPPVLWALDEVANIAPLPGLPSVVSEGGSQGLVSLVCLQDLSQARSRWGSAADGFLTLFGWKMLLPGIADYSTLQLVSALAGEHDVLRQARTRSTQWWASHPTNTVTTSYEHRPALPIDRISNLVPGTALVIGPSVPPTPVTLVPCWSDPWRQHISL